MNAQNYSDLRASYIACPKRSAIDTHGRYTWRVERVAFANISVPLRVRVGGIPESPRAFAGCADELSKWAT